MRIIHEWTAGRATIGVEGLSRPIRVLHISDSHIGLIDERDAQWTEACQELKDRFDSESRDRQGRAAVTAAGAFDELLTMTQSLQADLVALTGDMIGFPSQANIEFLQGRMADTGREVMYIAGNHDWHWPGLDYGSVVREKYWPVLEPLQGGQPACRSRQLGDVRFVAIENSDYQITEGQLEFAQDNLAEGLPTVVLMHLPVSVPSLRAAAIEHWGAPILMGDPEHRNPRSDKCWGPRLNPPITVEGFERVMAFVRLLAGSPNLVAILCGHLHFARADCLSPWAMQYVAPAGFECRYLQIELRPL